MLMTSGGAVGQNFGGGDIIYPAKIAAKVTFMAMKGPTNIFLVMQTLKHKFGKLKSESK